MTPIQSRALGGAVTGAVLGLLVSATALAQDAHYTTRQFGNRAWLLGGSFVGNPNDISAVYYNPGALALLGAPELELTGSVWEYVRVSVKDGQGTGQDLTDSNVDVLPSLIAGSLRFGFLGKSRMAYSLLTRQGFSYSLQSRGTRLGTDLAGVQGLDLLSTDVRLDQTVSEFWTGLSWAYPVTEHLGLGLTPFVATRRQELRFQTLAQGSGAAGQQLLATLGRDLEFDHVRVLLKVGASYQRGPWAVGLAVTTPSLALWGRGSVGYERAVQSQGVDSNAPAPVFNFQEDLPAHFRNSWSAAFGVSRSFGESTAVYASLEGYARVSSLSLVDAEPIVPRGTTETINGGYDFALKPLLNGALGVEQALGERVRVYLSGHTDFSALDSTPGTNALLGGWDLYHVASGIHFLLGRSRFTLGGNLAWGSKQTDRLAETFQQLGLSAPMRTLDVRYFQATLLIGASFSFKDTQATSGKGSVDEAPKADSP
ncbi:hypothetical protein HRD49_11340 [Corallococcus exiguus]|uniref:hypothetical protein n=1 Tax=Corallococcus TaxID=83461 RepID=UPI0011C486B5|nr:MULTISPECIES: hypothetical protein [Corallococcus]NNC18703.1 hypothetical protein [Corallococcus exiguus]NRD62340.1 hypothetical protein [Corallococcus exiguus]